MSHTKCRAFTLIELLLVISIIVLLMALLVPSLSSAMRATKIANAQRAVLTVHNAVMAYYNVYNAYPLDRTPDKTMNMTQDGSYPPYRYADGTVDGSVGVAGHTPLFNDGDWNNKAYGGKFLVYFLMGPYGTGWHRPKKVDSTDPNYRNRGITAEWDPPPALSDILENRPVEQGTPGSLSDKNGKPFAVFVDGFGLEGRGGGVIGYNRANAFYATPGDKWTENNGPFGATFYWDCRGDIYYPGDGKPIEQQTKMLDQCPFEFALISPGPDRHYGYRVTSVLHTDSGGNTGYRKGSWSSVDSGIIDDIANYPLN